MRKTPMQFVPLGDSAVLIQIDGPAESAAAEIQRCIHGIRTNPFLGLMDIVPSYTTVAVFYDPIAVAHEHPGSPFATVKGWLESRLAHVAFDPRGTVNEFVIPVVYGGEHGPDLEDVARQNGLAAHEVVALHSGTTYDVRAVGFSPGFPFLSGLPEKIRTPRRPTPRTRVSAGSVGIGGEQTGIYGIPTPGGWNLIGRTRWVLFDAAAEPSCLLQVGDRVRFEPVAQERWWSLEEGPLARNRNTRSVQEKK